MNQKNKQLPTAYDELGFALNALRLEVGASIVNRLQDLKVKAFEEKTAPLREELEKLRKENERLKLLLTDARDTRDLYFNANERLINTTYEASKRLYELEKLNQKLREALKSAIYIADQYDRGYYGKTLKACKEVLKGVQ